MEETKNKKTEEKITGKTKVKSVKDKKPKEKAPVDNKLQEENAKMNEKILRLSAEMQNMKRRYEEELAKSYKYDGEDIVKKLLPIVDNFERAIKLDDSNLSDELSKFLSGFKMIYGNLLDALNTFEIKEIDCLKKEFDPNCMEAVMTSHEDDIEPGIVLDVMQKGYMYKDKVLRVAMVKVSE